MYRLLSSFTIQVNSLLVQNLNLKSCRKNKKLNQESENWNRHELLTWWYFHCRYLSSLNHWSQQSGKLYVTHWRRFEKLQPKPSSSSMQPLVTRRWMTSCLTCSDSWWVNKDTRSLKFRWHKKKIWSVIHWMCFPRMMRRRLALLWMVLSRSWQWRAALFCRTWFQR